MKSLTVLALFAVLGFCDAGAFPESKIQVDLNLFGSVARSELTASEDLLPPIPPNPAVSELVKRFNPNPPRFGSYSVQIDNLVISGHETVELAYAMLVHYAKLSEAANCIKSNENIISAIFLRSLVPDYVIDIDNILESRIAKFDGKRSYEIDPYRKRLIHAIAVDIQPLIGSWPRNDAALEQIVNFDFDGEKSFREFVAEKEAEIFEKTAESFDILFKFQQILQLNSPIPFEKLSTALLNFVATKMQNVSNCYKKIQDNQIKSQSGTPTEIADALKQVLEYRYYLNGHLQEIILSLQQS